MVRSIDVLFAALLLCLAVCAAVNFEDLGDKVSINIGRGCNVINGIVYERDGTTHPLLESDKQKLADYSAQWEVWGQQLSDSIFGRGPSPKAPIMPCICKTCQ